MLYKCKMANTSAIWQQASHTTYQLSSPSRSTRAIQKSQTLNEKYLRIFWKKVRRMDHYQKNDKTERARGLVRKTKRGDRKRESNDSPEIPDRRMTSDIPGLPFGGGGGGREREREGEHSYFPPKIEGSNADHAYFSPLPPHSSPPPPPKKKEEGEKKKKKKRSYLLNVWIFMSCQLHGKLERQQKSKKIIFKTERQKEKHINGCNINNKIKYKKTMDTRDQNSPRKRRVHTGARGGLGDGEKWASLLRD